MGSKPESIGAFDPLLRDLLLWNLVVPDEGADVEPQAANGQIQMPNGQLQASRSHAPAPKGHLPASNGHVATSGGARPSPNGRSPAADSRPPGPVGEGATTGRRNSWRLTDEAQRRLTELVVKRAVPSPDRIMYLDRRCAVCDSRKPTRLRDERYVCDSCAAAAAQPEADPAPIGAGSSRRRHARRRGRGGTENPSLAS